MHAKAVAALALTLAATTAHAWNPAYLAAEATAGNTVRIDALDIPAGAEIYCWSESRTATGDARAKVRMLDGDAALGPGGDWPPNGSCKDGYGYKLKSRFRLRLECRGSTGSCVSAVWVNWEAGE